MALHGCQLKMVAILCCCKLILAQFHQPILDSSLAVPDVFAFFNSQFCCPILANEVSTLQLGVQTLMRLSCVEFKMGLCLFYTVFLSNQPCGSRPMKKQYPLSGSTSHPHRFILNIKLKLYFLILNKPRQGQRLQISYQLEACVNSIGCIL